MTWEIVFTLANRGRVSWWCERTQCLSISEGGWVQRETSEPVWWMIVRSRVQISTECSRVLMCIQSRGTGKFSAWEKPARQRVSNNKNKGMGDKRGFWIWKGSVLPKLTRCCGVIGEAKLSLLIGRGGACTCHRGRGMLRVTFYFSIRSDKQ